MKSFKVTSDPKRASWGSTNIIVDSINKAAQKMGIYSDNGIKLHYDCLGQSHGTNPDAFMIAYELSFPKFILQSVYPKPILGLSRENASFAISGGYPKELVDYSTLGVDRTIWPLTRKKYLKDKFVFLGLGESNTRGGQDTLVPAFCEQFKDNKNVLLYLKDRYATDTFKKWVDEYSKKYNCEIILDNRHLESWEEQIKIYESADVSICFNRSHTFGLVQIQSMSCGLPTLAISYSGFADYVSKTNALCIDFDIKNVYQEDIDELVKIGMRNYLLPINTQNYSFQPFWGIARKEDVKLKMQQILDDDELRQKLSTMSDWTASLFSWEKTVWNLQFILNRFV